MENAKNYIMDADKGKLVRFVVSDIQSLEMDSKLTW